MDQPISYRGHIPFFCEKSEADFQQDPYERYDDMVLRQSALHLADKLWKGYPMQAGIDFAKPHYPLDPPANILEIGCGVGRWIADLAQNFPNTNCWGIDYSYQMLKRAHEYWIKGEEITIDLANKGFPSILKLSGQQIDNLQFGLAKAEELPFENNSQNLVVSSFLLDRLHNPNNGLVEMHRVLDKQGLLILISPLNFTISDHWRTYYPPIKLYHLILQMGFSILDWKEEIIIQEPLDIRSNVVTWTCLGLVAQKDS